MAMAVTMAEENTIHKRQCSIVENLKCMRDKETTSLPSPPHKNVATNSENSGKTNQNDKRRTKKMRQRENEVLKELKCGSRIRPVYPMTLRWQAT